MSTRRILFSWIGHADLRAMADSLPEDEQQEALKGLNPPKATPGQPGPLKCLLDAEHFAEVHLLSDHPAAKNRLYLKWIGGDAAIHPVKLTDPNGLPRGLQGRRSLPCVRRQRSSPASDRPVLGGGEFARDDGLQPHYRRRRHNHGIDAGLRHRAVSAAPNSRICKLSAAEVMTPARPAMTPAAPTMTCCPRITLG